MKTIQKMIGSAILLTGLVTGANAQSTATASTTAVLVTPISIAKTTDMHFGTVAASATAGTVVLDYADGRTTTGGVSLPAGSTLQKTAVFTVTGEGTSGFSIAIPSAPITLTGSSSGTMTVSGFTADLGASSTLVAGSKTIKVKATLNVGTNQVAGTYTNASDLFVTVNYN
jgi:Domain of unknown function (DUF4402)